MIPDATPEDLARDAEREYGYTDGSHNAWIRRAEYYRRRAEEFEAETQQLSQMWTLAGQRANAAERRVAELEADLTAARKSRRRS